jgi:hypothetical protein
LGAVGGKSLDLRELQLSYGGNWVTGVRKAA